MSIFERPRLQPLSGRFNVEPASLLVSVWDECAVLDVVVDRIYGKNNVI